MGLRGPKVARAVSTDEAVAEIGRRVPMEQVVEDGAPAPGAAPGRS